MPTSIFTVETPAFPNENDSAFQDLGTVFTTSTDGVITGIRWYFPATLPSGTVTGLLWAMTSDTTGTELARADFASPVAGTWNVATLSSPVAVTAGSYYCASVHSPDRYVASTNVFNGASISNPPLTAVENLVPYSNGRFAFNQASPTFPATGSGSKASYFADVVFELPSTAAAASVVSRAAAQRAASW